jgi:hypothetical protein
MSTTIETRRGAFLTIAAGPEIDGQRCMRLEVLGTDGRCVVLLLNQLEVAMFALAVMKWTGELTQGKERATPPEYPGGCACGHPHSPTDCVQLRCHPPKVR